MDVYCDDIVHGQPLYYDDTIYGQPLYDDVICERYLVFIYAYVIYGQVFLECSGSFSLDYARTFWKFL